MSKHRTDVEIEAELAATRKARAKMAGIGDHITLVLTPLEARGLSIVADSGAVSLLDDEEATAAYIGNGYLRAAVCRALDKLDKAIICSRKLKEDIKC